MKHETIVIKKDIDTVFDITINALQKIGKIKNQNKANSKIEGFVWYGLQRVKINITLINKKKSTDIEIRAYSDDVLEIGGTKSIQKLIHEITTNPNSEKNSTKLETKKEKHVKNEVSFEFIQKNYKTLLILFAAITIIWAVFFSDKANQNYYYTKSGFGATFSKQDFDLLISCSANNDLQCIDRMLNSGTAIELESGIKVYLVESSFSGSVVIRPEGKTYNLWTVSEAITK